MKFLILVRCTVSSYGVRYLVHCTKCQARKISAGAGGRDARAPRGGREARAPREPRGGSGRGRGRGRDERPEADLDAPRADRAPRPALARRHRRGGGGSSRTPRASRPWSTRRVASELGAGTMRPLPLRPQERTSCSTSWATRSGRASSSTRPSCQKGWRAGPHSRSPRATRRNFERHAWMGDAMRPRPSSVPGPNALHHVEQSLAAVAEPA